jgi:hypothetical protein
VNSVLLKIADAVAAELAAAPSGTFSQPFTPARKTLPRFTLEELDSLRVTVVPKSNVSERIGRGLVQTDYAVDVAVMKYQPPATDGSVDQTEADKIVALGEEIEEFFTLRHLDGLSDIDALWVTAAWNPSGAPYAVELLETKNVMASILTLTFRVMRQKEEG